MSISFYFSAQWSERNRGKALKMSILSAFSVAKASESVRKQGRSAVKRIDRTRTKTKQRERENGEKPERAFVHLLCGMS